MSWWRRHWRWGLALVIVGLAGIAVVILYAVRKKKDAQALQTELAVMKAGAQVAGLEADRRARAVELKGNAKEAAAIAQEIATAKRTAVAAVKAVEGMSDDDIANEFRDLGY